jgi:hypothetical protein
MRILLIITCVASLAANQASAQVAAMPGMASPSSGATNTWVGRSTGNSEFHTATRGPMSGVARSYGSDFGQNNNTALGRNMTGAQVPASTPGQPLVNLNQRTVFHGGTMFHGSGAQRSMFQGSGAHKYNPVASQGTGAEKYNPKAQVQYGGSFGEFSGLPPDGMGNINIQVAQSAQTPAAIQAPQRAQTAAVIQAAQSAQTPAAFNVPSSQTFNARQNGALGNGVYGSSIYGGGYPLNNGVRVRTY